MEFENDMFNSCLKIVDSIQTDKAFNQNNTDFGEFIVDMVKDFYLNGITNSIKPKENEFTVFSSIVLQNKDEFKVITYSNGSKSLPLKNIKDKTTQIMDCHAEILSMRALKLFIMKCLIFNILKYNGANDPSFITNEEYSQFNNHSEFFDIFTFSKGKITIKEKVYFHLYISEFPCGDCSIYPLDFEDNNQTGSKTIQEVTKYISELTKNSKIFHDNRFGQFRSKSMRSDINKDFISFSLSCSDKILFKNIFGLQGNYLSRIIKTFYFTTLVITSNRSTEQTPEVTMAVNRGISLIRRFDHIKNLKEFFLSTNMNFVFNEPKIIITNSSLVNTNNTSRSDKNGLSFSAYWFYSMDNFNKIDSVSGYKAGVNIKNVNKEKSKLNICKSDLFRFFIKVLETYSSGVNTNIRSSRIDKVIKLTNKLISENNENSIQLDDLRILIKNKKYVKKKDKLKEILGLVEFLSKKNT